MFTTFSHICFFKFPTFPPFSLPISRLRRETGHVPPRQARVRQFVRQQQGVELDRGSADRFGIPKEQQIICGYQLLNMMINDD